MRRIARGLQKFVFENPEPFIINYKFQNEPESVNEPLSTVTSVNGHYLVEPCLVGVGGRAGQSRPRTYDEPMATITSKADVALITPYIARIGQTGFGGDGMQYPAESPLTTVTSKAEHLLVAPILTQYHSFDDSARGQHLYDPILTIDTSNRYALVSAFMAKHFGGNYTGAGNNSTDPVSTVTAKDHNAVVTSHLVKMKGDNCGQKTDEPLQTITAGGLHFGEVRAFLIKYYGQGTGQNVTEPMDTVVSKDRFGLVTIQGEDYQIVDIGMRMLEPKELFAAQGFPADYIIDRVSGGKPYPKSAQVARCGNSVPPPFAEALVRANLPDMAAKIKITSMEQLEQQIAI
jgi:DNA (cytosine-5)-methyltransferase 1